MHRGVTVNVRSIVPREHFAFTRRLPKPDELVQLMRIGKMLAYQYGRFRLQTLDDDKADFNSSTLGTRTILK
jgi:hypothetical protein